MSLKAIEIHVPVNRVPPVKQAAREWGLEISEYPSEQEGKIKMILLLTDNFDLFEMGWGMGIEYYYKSIANPLGDFIEGFEAKIEEIKRKQDDKL